MKMSKIQLAGLVVALACTVALPAAASDLPPAEEVLAKYTAAIGGDALDAVKNMAAEFTFEMPMQGVYSTGEEYWQKPGNHYLRIDLMSMGVADYEAGVTDGMAWEAHPMNGTRKRTGDEERAALRQAALNPYADWKAHFQTAETVAEEVVREKTCYKVVFTPAEGRTLNAYFDKESGLLIRQELVSQAGSKIFANLDDYEETQGITSARTVEQGGMDSYTVKYTSVAYDVEEIPEGTFEAPASLTATAPAE